jgi:hypothetical protein
MTAPQVFEHFLFFLNEDFPDDPYSGLKQKSSHTKYKENCLMTAPQGGG